MQQFNWLYIIKCTYFDYEFGNPAQKYKLYVQVRVKKILIYYCYNIVNIAKQSLILLFLLQLKLLYLHI